MRSPARPCTTAARSRAGSTLAAIAAAALLDGCGATTTAGSGTPTASSGTATTTASAPSGTATVGANGERTTPEGLVLPAYADGRRPRASDRAPCTTEVFIAAARRDVDMLDQPVRGFRCAGGYAAVTLELGQCPPVEGAPESRRACSNRKTSYWKAVDRRWRILTYTDAATAGCADVAQAGEPRFPRRLCGRP